MAVRVSSFQADHTAPRSCFLQKHLIDLFLGHRMMSGPFSDVNRSDPLRNLGKNAVSDQTVIDNHLRLFQHTRPFQGQQPHIPRPGAYQPDFSDLLFGFSVFCMYFSACPAICWSLFFLFCHSVCRSFLNCPASASPIFSASETSPSRTAVS